MRFIIAALLAALGLWAVYRAWRALRMAKAAQGWTRVQGRIVESRAELVQTGEGAYYEPVVVYTYEVHGMARSARNINVTPEAAQGSRETTEERLARYPVGKTVEVLVDPADPYRTCLRTKADLDLALPIILFALAGVTATGIFGG